MSPDQREMYRMAGVNRAADITGRWNITRQLLIIQPLLATAVVAQLQTGRVIVPNVVLAVAGFVASIIGYGLLARVGKWIELWTTAAVALEDTADEQGKRVFGGRHYVTMRRAVFSSARIIRLVSLLVVLGWIGMLVIFWQG